MELLQRIRVRTRIRIQFGEVDPGLGTRGAGTAALAYLFIHSLGSPAAPPLSL